MCMIEDEAYIRRALQLAAQAARDGDVPIGAVLVSGDLLARGKERKGGSRRSDGPRRDGAVARSGATTGCLASFGRDDVCYQGAVPHVRGRDDCSTYQAARLRSARSEGRRGRKRVRRPAIGENESPPRSEIGDLGDRSRRAVAAIFSEKTRKGARRYNR